MFLINISNKNFKSSYLFIGPNAYPESLVRVQKLSGKSLIFYPADLTNKDSLREVFSQVISLIHTGCLTTNMNKVSAFFMEKSPYFIENFDHFQFTIEVSFIILPYLGKKLKGNRKILI